MVGRQSLTRPLPSLPEAHLVRDGSGVGLKTPVSPRTASTHTHRHGWNLHPSGHVPSPFQGPGPVDTNQDPGKESVPSCPGHLCRSPSRVGGVRLPVLVPFQEGSHPRGVRALRCDLNARVSRGWFYRTSQESRTTSFCLRPRRPSSGPCPCTAPVGAEGVGPEVGVGRAFRFPSGASGRV